LNATQRARRDFQAVFTEIMENRLLNNARVQPLFFGSKKRKIAGENTDKRSPALLR